MARSSTRVAQEMAGRVTALEADFPRYVQVFLDSSPFTGPSSYFHFKTVALRRRCGSAIDAIRCDDFFDMLYATLTAWGMHRMGPGKTKLRDLPEIIRSVREQEDHIRLLQGVSLCRLPQAELASVQSTLATLIDHLHVSEADARIVANTKCLHHILPDLVPPVDRSYTYAFFYGRKNLTLPEKDAFEELFRHFHHIATSRHEFIASAVGESWNTSETKVIDNAIVGYGLTHPGSPSGRALKGLVGV